MRPRPPVSISPILGTLALAALFADPIAAQYGRQGDGRLQLPWENNRFRLTHASVEPGATLSAGGNQVLVYLTADADGRMPAEAVWQPAGAGAMQNRGRARLQAIAIELKEARGAASGTFGEALDAQYGVGVSPLIDNDRVLVVKQRYDPIAYGGPLHFHGEDVLVVYLRGRLHVAARRSLGAFAGPPWGRNCHPRQHAASSRQCRRRSAGVAGDRTEVSIAGRQVAALQRERHGTEHQEPIHRGT